MNHGIGIHYFYIQTFSIQENGILVNRIRGFGLGILGVNRCKAPTSGYLYKKMSAKCCSCGNQPTWLVDLLRIWS